MFLETLFHKLLKSNLLPFTWQLSSHQVLIKWNYNLSLGHHSRLRKKRWPLILSLLSPPFFRSSAVLHHYHLIFLSSNSEEKKSSFFSQIPQGIGYKIWEEIWQGKERCWDKQGTKRRQVESVAATALESTEANRNRILSDRVPYDSFTVFCFGYEQDRWSMRPFIIFYLLKQGKWMKKVVN